MTIIHDLLDLIAHTDHQTSDVESGKVSIINEHWGMSLSFESLWPHPVQ